MIIVYILINIFIPVGILAYCEEDNKEIPIGAFNFSYYKQFNFNWFGCLITSFLVNIIFMPWGILYRIYKFFTWHPFRKGQNNKLFKKKK